MVASNTASTERRAEQKMLLCETRPETAVEVLMQYERRRRENTKSRSRRGRRRVAHQGHSKRAGALSALFPLAVRSGNMAVYRVSASVLAVEMSSGFVLKQVPPAEDGLIRKGRATHILKAKLLSCI